MTLLNLYNKYAISSDESSKFLFLYQIIENISISVIKKRNIKKFKDLLDAYESVNYTYLERFLEVSDNIKKIHDSKLAEIVLKDCISDLKIYSERCKHIIDISGKGEIQKDSTNIYKKLGSYIYETRNKIVHAKNNFK
ncbi:hypothetical protein, partial [Bacteroides coprosuis]|uniref:hypothetical protein n=1 Tax=Bacteroides coprosuis TaxID=151276 RepID=UPI001D789A21